MCTPRFAGASVAPGGPWLGSADVGTWSGAERKPAARQAMSMHVCTAVPRAMSTVYETLLLRWARPMCLQNRLPDKWKVMCVHSSPVQRCPPGSSQVTLRCCALHARTVAGTGSAANAVSQTHCASAGHGPLPCPDVRGAASPGRARCSSPPRGGRLPRTLLFGSHAGLHCWALVGALPACSSTLRYCAKMPPARLEMLLGLRKGTAATAQGW